MNVFGYPMTDEQYDAGRAVIARDSFTADELTAALIEAGVPTEFNTAVRASGMLVNAARSNGEIVFDKDMWRRAPEPEVEISTNIVPADQVIKG